MFMLIRGLTEEQFDDIISMMPCIGSAELCAIPADCIPELQELVSDVETKIVAW